MNFVANFIKGIFIGAGAILPGISSGVICVITGIYEKLLNSVLNLFKSFKENIKFLLPIVIGGFVGIVLFGNVLKYLFYAYPLQVSFTFIGLVIGSIPALVKDVNKKGQFKFYYILYLLFAVFIGLAMVIIERNFSSLSGTEFSYLYLVFAGMCMSVGVVVPGVSSTVILMLLGVYDAYLTSVAGVYFPVLIPMGIGLVIGSLICMKAIKYFLDNYYMQTFYMIIGFTIGSVFVLYPGFTFDITGAISILCFALGFIASNALSTKN